MRVKTVQTENGFIRVSEDELPHAFGDDDVDETTDLDRLLAFARKQAWL